jgi:uncharacterized membrane protein YhhN
LLQRPLSASTGFFAFRPRSCYNAGKEERAVAHLIPVPVVALTVTLLVRAEFRNALPLRFVLKPLSTLLITVVALLSLRLPSANPTFTLWITAGLLLSLAGDVALMLESDRWFLIGLVWFLLAQIVYAAGLTLLNPFHPQDLLSAAVLLVVAVAVFIYLRPGLGSMQIPVAFYISVICLMVNRAISTFFGTAFTATQAWLLSLGACLFWLSDLLLAVNRFRHPFAANRLGLFLYFAGQLLIALSPSYFG